MENSLKISNGVKKNKIIIITLLVLIIGAAAYFIIFSLNKGKFKFGGESFTAGEGKIEETLSLSGKVSSVNTAENFLTVKPSGRENEEVKIIVSGTTKLIKLTAPFDEKNPPPPGTQFTPEEKEIKLSDFKSGDEILILTQKNIAGKTELDNITLIQILP